MSQDSPFNRKKFQDTILTWYAANQRDLPWRKTRNPYHILISEIMLQQTQVNRVIPKFEAWLKNFPTVFELANASTAEVLRLWSGLGYNRRALNLKKTAQIVAEEYQGRFPRTEKELMKLPGIGQYTARAVLCFAFDEQVAVVDTNVKKVVLTQVLKQSATSLRDGTTRALITDKELLALAEQLLPHGKAYEWNQALMDYASTVLKKEKIPIPKQSTFKGSRRYYRGKVLKLLLERKTIHILELGSIIKQDYTEEEQAWLKSIINELVKEKFIIIKNDSIQLVR